MPQPRSVIVLVIDRLGAGFLGPYGNTWLETPAFNQLASKSLLCEQMIGSSPDLATIYRDYWLGADACGQTKSLPAIAKAAGCSAILLTDDEEVQRLAGSADFDECHFISTSRDNSQFQQPVDDPAASAFAAVMELARELLRTRPQPCFLWIHARAMNGLWDAPVELRQQFGDEDDPAPAEIVQPPEEQAAKGEQDPDYLLSLAHAYAGQVSMVDICLQSLLEAVDELPNTEECIFAVTSPRGYPLGEHGRIGPCDNALFGELLQVPCLIRLPDGEGALLRLQELTQPGDLLPTIAEGAGWLEPTDTKPINECLQRSLLRLVRGEPGSSRQLIQASAPKQKLIRTPAWQLRVTTTEAGEQYELFTKPDDRWEANDVANRCGDIVAALIDHAANPLQSELATELTSPWR
ncbi:Sulfatase [Anatilimnocola aggregata]|uniref:Sulfatase n=1 Tax=Anatilimnocola aggregata TaxID=2528021 RepID=A0A517YKK1_9BACT|nr:sulfatase-like hydrolase/transferase [Anatilimnocola aggregata]QDU30752.1 Sulfatase [Anatilimnocola aggregata]